MKKNIVAAIVTVMIFTMAGSAFAGPHGGGARPGGGQHFGGGQRMGGAPRHQAPGHFGGGQRMGGAPRRQEPGHFGGGQRFGNDKGMGANRGQAFQENRGMNGHRAQGVEASGARMDQGRRSGQGSSRGTEISSESRTIGNSSEQATQAGGRQSFSQQRETRTDNTAGMGQASGRTGQGRTQQSEGTTNSDTTAAE